MKIISLWKINTLLLHINKDNGFQGLKTNLN